MGAFLQIHHHATAHLGHVPGPCIQWAALCPMPGPRVRVVRLGHALSARGPSALVTGPSVMRPLWAAGREPPWAYGRPVFVLLDRHVCMDQRIK